jgi:hypothetical protein
MEIDGESVAIERGSARDPPQNAVLRGELPTGPLKVATCRLRALAWDKNVDIAARVRSRRPIEALLQIWALEEQDRDTCRTQIFGDPPGFLLSPQGQHDPAHIPSGGSSLGLRVGHLHPPNVWVEGYPTSLVREPAH